MGAVVERTGLSQWPDEGRYPLAGPGHPRSPVASRNSKDSYSSGCRRLGPSTRMVVQRWRSRSSRAPTISF